MATRKKTKDKEPRVKYNPEFNKLAYQFCLLGATDEELAEFFGVALRTIQRWKIDHPDFMSHLKRGKDQADANIATRLYQRAMGFEHPEDKIFLHEGEPIVVPTTKHYAPDVTACIFWLKNRQKSKWRDVKDFKGVIEKVEKIHEESKKYKDLTDEELLEEIQREINPN